MKSKFRKILLVFVIMFSFTISVNAETKIIEDTSTYEGDVYIIGSSKFDSDIIITGTMASKAGAREAYIQYIINKNMNFNVDDIKVYYYCGLDGKWSLLPATENDTFRDLTDEEVKELTEELKIYYVNEKEKILEIPYDTNLKDGYELVFGVDDPSKLSDVKYEEGKIFVPATVKTLNVLAKNKDNEHIILDTFEQVDTEFEIKTSVVTTLEELKGAIASEKEEIRLGNDITGITETINIPYTVTFRGAGYKLAFENVTQVNDTASGLVISGDESFVENLTIEMDDIEQWHHNYGLQVYNAKNVTITNYKGTKADAALLVNGSIVTVQGNIDVSGNEFGGIEVSKGTAEGLANSVLNVNGTILIEDESVGKPAIWIENGQGEVVLEEGIEFIQNTNVPTALGKNQTFYYTSDSVYENVEVTSADELLLAAALTEIKSIKLASDIDLETAVEITNKLTIDLNGHNLTVKNDTEGNGVFYVREGGDLTINGEGTIDGVGNNIYNIAIFADGGKVTLNGGTYTNVNTVVNPEDSDSDHYDLIYAKGTAQIVINGGRYEGKTPAWLLNLKDNARETSSITVYGGTFVGFNPANNEAEGVGTNFVADGYKAVESNGEYTVVVNE